MKLRKLRRNDSFGWDACEDWIFKKILNWSHLRKWVNHLLHETKGSRNRRKFEILKTYEKTGVWNATNSSDREKPWKIKLESRKI